jgi:uncharacterized protein
VTAATPEPSRRLAAGARTVWRLQQLGTWAIPVVAGFAIAGQLDGAAAAAVRWLPLVAGLVAVVAVPELRWRRWRWDVRPEAIDVRHGALTVRRTLVPMERVQHVDTSRGILEQSFNLATVVVHTAADSHTIPLLSVPDADEVRDRIAALARTSDAS